MSLNKTIYHSLLTHVAPAFVAIVAIPFILRNLGQDKYGLITIFWSLIGIVTLFELGMSRIVTKEVAKSGSLHSLESQKIIKSSLFLILGFLCSIITLALCFKSELVLFYFKKNALTKDIENSLVWFLLSVPTLLILQIFKSAYEGVLHFPKANLIQILNSSINYFIPLLVSFFSTEISTSFLFFFLSRWAVTFYVFVSYSKAYSLGWLKVKISIEDISHLFNISFWFLSLAIINPFLVYIDRVIVGYHIELSQIGYYTTAFEIATRLWLIPNAITRIAFSLFAKEGGHWNAETKLHFTNALRWLVVSMFSVVTILYIFGENLISAWLNKAYAAQITETLNIILIGIFFNSINWLILSYLQLTSAFALSVKLVILQSVIYLLLLGPVVSNFGAIGSSYMWTLRLVADFMVSLWLFLKTIQSLPPSK
jgi:O-antigen/teichoic acid export membrane protein